MIRAKICNNCGAPCGDNDIYCKSCGISLSENYESAEPIIKGIDNKTLREYIGKNSDYYLNKFAKAKNKKIFVQLNPHALLFGPTWFFYRKMSRIAVLYTAVIIALTTILSAAVPLIFAKDVEAFDAAYAELNGYRAEGGEVFAYDEDGAIVGSNETYKALKNKVKDAQHKLNLISLLINLPVLILNIGFRFFANAVYKSHIKRNVTDNDGGTTSKFKAFLLINVVSTVIITVIGALILFIPEVSGFNSALNTML